MTGHSHRSARAFLLAAAFAFAGPNPGASSAQDGGGGALDEILSRFQDRIAACTARYGYSRAKGDVLGAREFGENEVPWRHCVYRGVREVLMPQARVPRLYQQAIEEDQAMTARIAKGELTRAERRQRLEDLAENIRLTELLEPTAYPRAERGPGVTRPGQAGAPQADVSLFGARLTRPLTAIRHRRRSGAVPRISRSPDYETEPA